MVIRFKKSSRDDTSFYMKLFPIWSLIWAILAAIKRPSGSGVVISGVLFLCALICLIRRSCVDRFLGGIWLCFFAYNFLRLPVSNFVSASLDLFVCFSSFLISAVMSRTDYDARKMINTFYYVGVIVALCVIVDIETGFFSNTLRMLYSDNSIWVRKHRTHTEGLFVYTGTTGGFIVCSLGAWFFKCRIEKRIRIMRFAMLGILILVLFYIRKRGFLLDLAIIIVFFGSLNIFIRKRSISKGWIFGGIVAIGAIILFYFSSELFRDSVTGIIQRFSKGSTLSGRSDLYGLAMDLFKKHPLVGIGWGNYREQSLGVLSAWNTYEVHNVYLQLLCETGVIGLMTFLIPVAFTFVQTVKNYIWATIGGKNSLRQIIGFSLFLQLFFLTYCLSGNPLYDYNFLVMYFAGIMIMNGGRIKCFGEENSL